ncbi:hypothetical protein [Roseateles sp. YR242]|uniref:hypothetical protein n=1 Tax=Roseateles sp. YR242 TaxID=1855305 RepID=UPI001C43583A|nr:hypothetical protein [Roseateles sp. YR242]
MMHNSRYSLWLEVANELVTLHEFAYSGEGPFASFANSPCMPTGIEAADWIRKKCQTGRWYWWDKTSLAAKAHEPLHSMLRVIGDGGGRYEDSEVGKEMLARIRRLDARIAEVAAA